MVLCGEEYCPFVARARAGLKKAGLQYEFVSDMSRSERDTLREITGIFTIPQVFVHGISIGGCDDGKWDREYDWQGTLPCLQRGTLQKAFEVGKSDKAEAEKILRQMR